MRKKLKVKCVICGRKFKTYSLRRVTCGGVCARTHTDIYQRSDKIKQAKKEYAKVYWRKKRLEKLQLTGVA